MAKKIKKIDRETCRMLGEEIEEKLQVIARKYGINIKRGRGTYDSKGATIKIEIATVDRDGTVNSKEAEDFKRYARMEGLKEEWLGQSFRTWDGKELKIVGFKPRSTKYPVIVEDNSGKRWKYPAKQVKREMGKPD